MAVLISNLLLNPLITGSLWALETRSPLTPHLLMKTSRPFMDILSSVLVWLTVLGGARWANAYLSELAQNNFRLSSEKHRYDWPNEVALITGGTGGFGRLMAKGLAEKGVKCILVDIIDSLPKEMAESPELRGKVFYYKCDITDPNAVKDLASRVKSEHGDPSILINNAGVGFTSTILNIAPENVQRTFAVNILSHYYMCQAFVRAMVKNKKGHVVTLASFASFATVPGMVAYCNTKSAALSFHEGLQHEIRTVYRAPEVKFTVVHPTFASTPMLAPYEKQLRAAGTNILDPRMVADAVVKQIFSGRGKQLLIAPGRTWLNTFRSWPHWLSTGLVMFTDTGRQMRYLTPHSLHEQQ